MIQSISIMRKDRIEEKIFRNVCNIVVNQHTSGRVTLNFDQAQDGTIDNITFIMSSDQSALIVENKY